MTEEKFQKIVAEHQGHYRLFDGEGFRYAAWWDAYGDLTQCNIAYGRILEASDDGDYCFLRHNWIYCHPGGNDEQQSEVVARTV